MYIPWSFDHEPYQAKGLIMSHSYTILGDTVAAADVSVPFFDFTSFELQKVETAKDGAIVATYKDVSVSTLHEVVITVRIKDTPARAGSPARRDWTISHKSWATDTDSVTGDVIYNDITEGAFGSWPLMDYDLSDLRDYIGSVYSLTFATVASKVPATDIISALLHGLPQLYS